MIEKNKGAIFSHRGNRLFHGIYPPTTKGGMGRRKTQKRPFKAVPVLLLPLPREKVSRSTQEISLHREKFIFY